VPPSSSAGEHDDEVGSSKAYSKLEEFVPTVVVISSGMEQLDAGTKEVGSGGGVKVDAL